MAVGKRTGKKNVVARQGRSEAGPIKSASLNGAIGERWMSISQSLTRRSRALQEIGIILNHSKKMDKWRSPRFLFRRVGKARIALRVVMRQNSTVCAAAPK
ncbi:hypothetical protein [Rhodoblastus sp.]|uniref:hypothetical protein n=1 Tax=Rhodoblastus sp. TaxID=1962975 RepID=UPI0025EEF5C0|nr:hypothetical protein [Rhodoblastus sp.]